MFVIATGKSVFFIIGSKFLSTLLIWSICPYTFYQGILYRGGIWLVEIIFQNKQDVDRIIKLFRHKFKFTNWKIDVFRRENDCSVQLNKKTSQIDMIFIEKIKLGLSEFILNYKVNEWAKEILKEQYMYEDDTEQRHIVEILNHLMDGEKEELVKLVDHLHLKRCLKETINELIKEDISFSFDSLVKFRLRTFFDLLKKYVEVSIDEYKMEQEYQVFIHTLRDFLEKSVPKVQCLHVLVDLDIQFYDSNYQEITQKDLMVILDSKLFSYQSVYIDPFSMGPLLSLAPKIIYLYTEDREQPIVRTIMNVFEERVIVLEKYTFFQGTNSN